jgi:biotin carboxylase
MHELLMGKRLLILGGNPETRALVDVANSMGVITVVADPNPIAPAKANAQIAVNVDGMDVNAIVGVALSQSVDGVLVGVADILVPSYQEVCQLLNFPCYASKKVIKAFSSKDGFIEICKKYSVTTTPSYSVDLQGELISKEIEYPVIVKPVDSGAGVGMTVCHSAGELQIGIKKALSHSIQKRVVVEKFMQGDDLFAYYTFVDGTAHLSALADRYTTRTQNIGSPVCIGASYPSIHLKPFLEFVNPKLLKMFKGLDIKNGVLNIQFFHESGDYFAYDPGFRLQGEGPHLHMLAANGFDHRQMLINFALTGEMYSGDFELVNDVFLNGKYAITVWILLSEGTIGEIDGLQKVRKLESFQSILNRFVVGDRVDVQMLGTERQVFARIYLQNQKREKLLMDVDRVNEFIKVTSIAGGSMIIDSFRRLNRE